MNFKNSKFYIIVIITFIIVFLMNYIGSDAPDRLYRALLTALGGAVGISVGLWIWHKNKDDSSTQHFD
ncbi:hypothetical protein [Riemerella columbina]|uniref:hypothetical protein n=1 Tax=Riemerella columbina TaxID=103810 RepID=UPI000360315E|nr:hypothetical protein [Riemerella columbina]